MGTLILAGLMAFCAMQAVVVPDLVPAFHTIPRRFRVLARLFCHSSAIVLLVFGVRLVGGKPVSAGPEEVLVFGCVSLSCMSFYGIFVTLLAEGRRSVPRPVFPHLVGVFGAAGVGLFGGAISGFEPGSGGVMPAGALFGYVCALCAGFVLRWAGERADAAEWKPAP